MCFTFLNAEAQNEDSKLWTSTTQLQWSDFIGKPEPKQNVVAITASGITFGYSVTKSETKIEEANFTIEAHFYPEHSWCLKDKIDDNILNHERFHFNLTELFARKLRKQIAETNFTLNLKAEADAIYNNINKELQAMQKQYDAETNFSINVAAQKQWQAKIEKQLKALERFKLK